MVKHDGNSSKHNLGKTMIYAKALDYVPYLTREDRWSIKDLAPLSKSQCRPDDIYWFDKHDTVIKGIKFENCIDDRHWDNLQQHSSTRLLIVYDDESLGRPHMEGIINVLRSKNISPDQVLFIMCDNLYRDWVKKILQKYTYPANAIATSIMLKDTFLHNTRDIKPSTTRVKKFSVLSRMYKPWRMEFFCRLNRARLLPYFNFSCWNLNPYTSETFSIKQIKQDLRNHCTLNNVSRVDKKFLMGLPYSLPGVLTNIHTTSVTQSIVNSDIHIVIETTYRPEKYEHLGYQDLCPGFTTEKFFKALFYKKPFIAVTTPYFLQQVRTGYGFKTFSPLIDESYDTIEDPKMRMEAIVAEITRLSNLTRKEFRSLLKQCKSICDYNFTRCEEIIQEKNLNSASDFLKPYVNSYYLS